MVPLANLRTNDFDPVTPAFNSTLKKDQRPNFLIPSNPVQYTEDDIVVRDQPLRYVDYLCHDWKKEDIQSLQKHVISKRKANSNNARFKNVLQRTWTKSRYQLKTIPPETLNQQAFILMIPIYNLAKIHQAKRLRFNMAIQSFLGKFRQFVYDAYIPSRNRNI